MKWYEFADFELYPYTFSLKKPRPLSQPKNSYARDALKEGLAYELNLALLVVRMVIIRQVHRMRTTTLEKLVSMTRHLKHD